MAKNTRAALLAQLKPQVASVYVRFGMNSATASGIKKLGWHEAWGEALQGETPVQARERAAIIAKLEAIK